MDKFFVLVNTLDEFRNLKFSFDEENQTYVTYDEPNRQTFGTPDILWSQIVFVADSSIIYTKGTIYTNYIKPDTGIPTTDLEESIQTILSNAGAKITLADLKLSENYEKSSYTTASDLVLNVGDLYDTAFGKIEKKLDDNITYLNDSYTFLINSKQDIIGDLDAIRNHAEVGYLKPVPVQSDWNAESGLSYILNKPDLSIYLTSETQPDWEEDNTTSAAYILNKPDLSQFLTIQTNSNWNETNTSSAAYIQNKPTIPELVKSDWNESDSTSYAYILNKPSIIQYADILSISYGGSNIILFKNSGNLSVTSNNNINFNAGGTELVFSSNGAVFLEGGSNTLSISQYDTHLLFNDENIAFQSEAFDGNISLSTNDESAIDNIENGMYHLQYIDIIYEEGEPIGEDIVNSAVLVQKTLDNQYMYIDGIVKHRVYTENDGWSEWEQIGGVQSDWNVSDSTSYAYILNKPTIPTVPTTSTTVTENDTNPVSGGAVYAKFADLIGTAPAALDTLGEIAAALNNDADLASTLTNQITSKIPKVSNPTTGNFAYFNSDGTIADSSYNYNTFLTSETQLSKGTTTGEGNAVTDITVNNHEITLTKGATFLTEHQSLKTVNNESLVGTGNIVISGLPQVSASDNGKILMVVNGQWQLVSPSVLYSGQGVPNNANGNNGDLYMQTE